jgi:hypothetical protein
MRESCAKYLQTAIPQQVSSQIPIPNRHLVKIIVGTIHELSLQGFQVMHI